MPRALQGHVIAHTHWDRAWYWTFEESRARLLDLMDDLLALLGRDPSFRNFLLDGQLAMVQDYLELRPGAAPGLRALARAGRLQLGPFFVLPDLFIPSGESLVRNLRLGQALAAQLGSVLALGYLPDPFGHPAQLPQILRGFGIEGAVLSRGLGDEGETLGADFLWESPDGSRVLCTHQIGGGYCNLARLGEPPDSAASGALPATAAVTSPEAVERAARTLRDLVAAMGPACPHGHLLLGNGCDHLPAQPGLPALLRALNRRRLGIRLTQSTPLAYQRAVNRAIAEGRFTPAVHQGELRGSRYANLLAGVLSARVDLKLRLAEGEALLLRWAEPFTALARATGRGRDDRALLGHAWRLLLLCQPHDDICGCSIDAVHGEDLARMARVVQVATLVRDRALTALADGEGPRAGAGRSGALVFNPHPWAVRALVRVPRSWRQPTIVGGALPYQRVSGGMLVQAELPPLGWLPLADRCTPSSTEQQPPLADGVMARAREGSVVLSNAHVEVRLDTHARLSLRDHRSGLVLRRAAVLLDEGDAGDTYDFSPPARQHVVTGPAAAGKLRIRERGPLRAVAELSAALRLPIGLAADRRSRSSRTRRLPLRLRVEVSAGSPRVELQLWLRNTVDEHRLRLALEAPCSTDGYWAGQPFAVQRCPVRIAPRPHWHQPPALTRPFSGFVALEDTSSRGIAILAPGLHEVEAQPARRGTRLLVTLLRSVTWLSRDDLTTRRGHAGPDFPVEGARLQGELSLRLALLPYLGGWAAGGVARQAAEHETPPRLIETALPEEIATGTSCLALSPAGVALAALLPAAEGCLEARLVNLTGAPVTASLRGPFTGRRCRLDGRPRRGAVDLDAIPLRAGEIATLLLRPRARR